MGAHRRVSPEVLAELSSLLAEAPPAGPAAAGVRRTSLLEDSTLTALRCGADWDAA